MWWHLVTFSISLIGMCAGSKWKDVSSLFVNPSDIYMHLLQGQTAYLDCQIIHKDHKMITWLRTDRAIQLITYGPNSFHDDARFSLSFAHPHNWRLRISDVKISDSGRYDCQVSTDPPIRKTTHLTVHEPLVQITNRKGHEVKELHVKKGSFVSLRCVLGPVDLFKNLHPTWYHSINGAIRKRRAHMWTTLEQSVGKMELWLHIRSADESTSGLYRCGGTDIEGASFLLDVTSDETYSHMLTAGTRRILSTEMLKVLTLSYLIHRILTS